MIDRGKQNLLGVLIDAVDYEAAVTKILDAAKARRSFTVSALAVHGVMTGVLDPTHGARLNHLDLVTPDGQPVRWALNLLYGVQLPDRVYGPTLTLKVCERAAQEGLSIYLYGSKQTVLDALIHNLTERIPGLQIAGAQPSRFRPVTPAEQAEIVRTIQESGAAITLVGLGCPRQEVWVYEHGRRGSL
jgi:N-acetylglucosaminyldiphosphoundecaprenol N-acetyl-beta-D-mannosaminyltransferase